MVPSGGVHDATTLAVTALTALPVAYVAFDSNTMSGVEVAQAVAIVSGFIVGGLTGLVMSPDLDQAEGWGSKQLYRGGRLFGRWWVWYWWPYGKMSKHRGLSHAPIIGTLTRVAYGLPWFLPLLVATFFYWPLTVAWLLGLMWSDLWHTIMDHAL